jgi:uncharacterized protein with HEPN domain
MSESTPPREWRFYVEDMIAFCDKVLTYTQGLDRVSFASDPMRHDAALRNLELIGEAETHVPAGVRAAPPDVPWRMVVAVRNRLIHGYLGVDDDIAVEHRARRSRAIARSVDEASRRATVGIDGLGRARAERRRPALQTHGRPRRHLGRVPSRERPRLQWLA